jgi:competence protein ComEC
VAHWHHRTRRELSEGQSTPTSPRPEAASPEIPFFFRFPFTTMKRTRTFLRHLSSLVLATGLVATSGQAADGKFTMTVLEIPDIQRGAGLAIVLQTPSGKNYLYDTGTTHPSRLSSDGWEKNFNAGRDVVMPFLKKQNITSLDGIFISHAHYDHFGGLLWLMDQIPIKQLVDSGYVYEGEAPPNYVEELGHYNQVRDTFKGKQQHRAAFAGEKLDLDPDLEVEVIAPPRAYFNEPNPASRPKNDPPAHYLVNSNSLSLRIRHGKVVFYLPGDIQTEDITQSLLKVVPPDKLKCQILIAPGHGIHGTKEFAEATRPEVSIASVFPRYAKGLKSTPLLKAVGAKTYITGLNGNVQVVSDGSSYRVTAERDNDAPAPAVK